MSFLYFVLAVRVPRRLMGELRVVTRRKGLTAKKRPPRGSGVTGGKLKFDNEAQSGWLRERGGRPTSHIHRVL